MSIGNVIRLFLKDNDTAILTGFAIAGVVSTGIFAGKASLKADKILEEAEKNTKEPLDRKEKLKLVAPAFIPAGICCGLTITCICKTHSMDSNKLATMTYACSMSERAMKTMEEKLGDKKLKSVRESIFEDDVRNDPPRSETIRDTGRGKTKFRDGIFGGDFYSDIEYVKSVFNKYNKMLNDGDIVYVNDIRWDLGLPQTEIGSMMGWDCGQLDEMLTSVIIERDLQDVSENDVDNIFVISYNRPTLLHHGY